MGDLTDALLYALVALGLITGMSLPFRPPRACSLCGIHLRGRDVVRHVLDHHSNSQETPMCDRPDWACVNDQPHDAPRGCVHHSATGSDVPDRHDTGSGGEH